MAKDNAFLNLNGTTWSQESFFFLVLLATPGVERCVALRAHMLSQLSFVFVYFERGIRGGDFLLRDDIFAFGCYRVFLFLGLRWRS